MEFRNLLMVQRENSRKRSLSYVRIMCQILVFRHWRMHPTNNNSIRNTYRIKLTAKAIVGRREYILHACTAVLLS